MHLFCFGTRLVVEELGRGRERGRDLRDQLEVGAFVGSDEIFDVDY